MHCADVPCRQYCDAHYCIHGAQGVTSVLPTCHAYAEPRVWQNVHHYCLHVMHIRHSAHAIHRKAFIHGGSNTTYSVLLRVCTPPFLGAGRHAWWETGAALLVMHGRGTKLQLMNVANENQVGYCFKRSFIAKIYQCKWKRCCVVC